MMCEIGVAAFKQYDQVASSKVRQRRPMRKIVIAEALVLAIFSLYLAAAMIGASQPIRELQLNRAFAQSRLLQNQ
jgi:hypothetical protein